jgi:hypothetical protein
MVIHLGKSKILKRQMPQTSHGVIRRKLPAPYFLKQLIERFRVQRRTRYEANALYISIQP